MNKNRQIMLLLCVALGVGFAIGYARIKMDPNLAQDTAEPMPLAGLNIGGPFTLTDHNGKTVTEKSWPQKYLLVYFGFTHCPDVCPTGLGKLADALNTLPAETVAKIQPLFITIDPARDTIAALKDYVILFHKNLIGLTGTQEQIDSVIKEYRVYAQKQVTVGDEANYMMNHSSYTYLVAPDGHVIDVYAHDATPANMADKIKKVIIK